MPKRDLKHYITESRGLTREAIDDIYKSALVYPPGEEPDSVAPGIPTDLEINYSIQDFQTFVSVVEGKWDTNPESDCVGYILRHRRLTTAPQGWTEYSKDWYLMSSGAAYDKMAVRFTTKLGGNIHGVHLLLKREGSPGGSVRAAIYSDDGTGDHFPLSVITNGYSSWVLVSTVDTSVEWIDFEFPNYPSLTYGTIYHAVFEADASYTYSVSNRVFWESASSPTDTVEAYTASMDTWVEWPGSFTFILYGDSGSGTGAADTFTDSDASWPRRLSLCILRDSNSDEWDITDSTPTQLTISGTPSSGSYAIFSPWQEYWVSHDRTEQYTKFYLGEMQGGYYHFQVLAEDLWNNRSPYSDTVMEFIPGPGLYAIGLPYPVSPGAPQNLTSDFTGANCVLTWDVPATFRPDMDFKIEVRDSSGGSILGNPYYISATSFTLDFDENTRLHSPSSPSPTIHFTVYTRDSGGNLSTAATTTATNAAPSQPSSITYDFDGRDCIIFVDVGTETDIQEVLYDVQKG